MLFLLKIVLIFLRIHPEIIAHKIAHKNLLNHSCVTNTHSSNHSDLTIAQISKIYFLVRNKHRPLLIVPGHITFQYKQFTYFQCGNDFVGFSAELQIHCQTCHWSFLPWLVCHPVENSVGHIHLYCICQLHDFRAQNLETKHLVRLQMLNNICYDDRFRLILIDLMELIL